jgi:hypothetical protein
MKTGKMGRSRTTIIEMSWQIPLRLLSIRDHQRRYPQFLTDVLLTSSTDALIVCCRASKIRPAFVEYSKVHELTTSYEAAFPSSVTSCGRRTERGIITTTVRSRTGRTTRLL